MWRKTLTRSPKTGAPFGAVPEDWPKVPPAPVPEPEATILESDELAELGGQIGNVPRAGSGIEG